MSFLISVDVTDLPTTNKAIENEPIITVQTSEEELTTTIADELVTSKSVKANKTLQKIGLEMPIASTTLKVDTYSADVEEPSSTIIAPLDVQNNVLTEEVMNSDSIEEVTTPPEIKIESSTILISSTVPLISLVATGVPTTSSSVDETTSKEIETDPSIITTVVSDLANSRGVPEDTTLSEVAEGTTLLSADEIGKKK